MELKDAATKQFQADLKKYANVTGVPDYGMYTGYILADYAIAALQKAGNPPTRQGLIDGAHGIGQYDQAGLACQPVDVSLGGRGKVPATSCAYVVKLKDGKFCSSRRAASRSSGSSSVHPTALAANKAGEAVTTTTAAPASP